LILANQREVIDFLAKLTTRGATVARVDTHGSVVFLAGKRVYKLKRAILFEYMDHSSLERRRTACEAEVRVNRRTAPGIYRRAVPIYRSAGSAQGALLGFWSRSRTEFGAAANAESAL
jgi:hypothetical protein